MAQAESIIDTRVQNFMQWLDARSIVPVLQFVLAVLVLANIRRPQAQIENLRDGQARKDPAPLRHQRDPVGRQYARNMGRKLFSVDKDPARGRPG